MWGRQGCGRGAHRDQYSIFDLLMMDEALAVDLDLLFFPLL